MQITRRSAVFSGLALGSIAGVSCKNKGPDYPISFNHGVASGDPTSSNIILWTRITPSQEGSLTVYWQISNNKKFQKKSGYLRTGKTSTNKNKDYTVKVDVSDLKPGQTYYYRFFIGNTFSPIGRTKTLSNGYLEHARLAVVSCSNFPFGFFNVYEEIANNNGFDAVLHLGDYIYEYGTDSYGGKTGRKLGRNHMPEHEIISLSDYRTRYAQYKSDLKSQAIHAAHPFICIWDDHETANNSWKAGAQNHSPNEGSWDKRKMAALQAYYEWMPVREPELGQPQTALFRDFNFGDLFSLAGLETRLSARSKPIDYDQYLDEFNTKQNIDNFINNILWDESREMLGKAQTQWLKNHLKTSVEKRIKWRLIANQVMLTPMLSADLRDYKDSEAIEKIAKFRPSIRQFIDFSPLGLPVNLDAWDGYPAARDRFYTMAKQVGADDLLVLTGDTHVNWVNKLANKNGDNMGIELGVTGTTSPGLDSFFKEMTDDYLARMQRKNPEIIWAHSKERGFIDLQISRKNIIADFVCVSTTHAPKYHSFVVNSFQINKQGNKLYLNLRKDNVDGL